MHKFDHYCWFLGCTIGDLNHLRFWCLTLMQTFLVLWGILLARSGLSQCQPAGTTTVQVHILGPLCTQFATLDHCAPFQFNSLSDCHELDVFCGRRINPKALGRWYNETELEKSTLGLCSIHWRFE